MNRQQKRRQKRSFDPPEGYKLAVRQVTEAFQRWMRDHPDAQLRFRLPTREACWFGPLDARNIDLLAMTEDARLLLEYMDEASNHQANVNMAAAVIETFGNLAPTAIVKVAPFVCPYCGARLTAVTDPTLQGHLPGPGALAICDQCTEVGIFCEDMTVRKFTALEMQSVNRDQLAEIQAYRANLKASRGRPTS